MTQKPIDLLAALKKKGVQFIFAGDETGAIQSIEGAMGKCWTDAKGSRHLAHQTLDEYFVPVVLLYSNSVGKYLDEFVEGDKLQRGEVLEREVWGYDLLTDVELRERESHVDLKLLRRTAEKAKPRHHHETSSRATKRRLEPQLTSEKHFDNLVARIPGVSPGHPISGGLSLG